MKRNIIILFSLVTLLGFSQDIDSCDCCTEVHKAFDFWEGNWEVTNEGGTVVGTNNIIKIQDGCILQENWIAANGSNTGSSYNFYNVKDESWNQIWISNSGNVLELKGGINDKGQMVLRSEIQQGEQGKFYNRITWTPKSDGSVIQHWELLNEKDEIVGNAFKGIYKKMNKK